MDNRFEVSYSGPGDAFDVRIPADFIAELIAPFSGRRRAYLVALLNGRSKSVAAAHAGVTARCAQMWAKRDPEFGATANQCDEMGFALVEAALSRRALAGKNARGSMRALELMAMSRRERYRETDELIGRRRMRNAAGM